MSIMVWLGSAAPVRSVRWLDGALGAAGKLGAVTAVAAGARAWLDLVADRASRANVASAGVETDQQLDFLGWAQLAAACAKHLGATTIIVDEASRPERAPEVGAIAELLGAVHLTRAIALRGDGDVVFATRAAGGSAHELRVRGLAVIGVRIPGPPIEDYPTPTPSVAMRRIDIAQLAFDGGVLAHRARPPRAATPEPRPSIDRVVAHLAPHLAPAHQLERGT